MWHRSNPEDGTNKAVRLRERWATAAVGAYFLAGKWTGAAASRGATASPTWTNSWRRRTASDARRRRAASPRLPTSSVSTDRTPPPPCARDYTMRAKNNSTLLKTSEFEWSCRPAAARREGDADGRRPTARLERRSERARVRRQTWARGDGLRRHGQAGAGPRWRARGRRLLRGRHAHYRAPARFPAAARLPNFVGPLQNLVGLIHFLLWASSEMRLDSSSRYDDSLVILELLLCARWRIMSGTRWLVG